ncbi:MAG: uracil-DNA glycosylase family protein [Myxococcota bacterium]
MDLARRKKRLATLMSDAESCDECKTMPGHPRALGPGNGSVEARCLVIATAPGATGAATTGIPLQGDRAGSAFEQLMAAAGIGREQLYITNAVLCTPTTKAGAGRRPRLDELRNCSQFVGGLIVALDPVLVVTLGSTSLRGLETLAPHGLTLRKNVGRPVRWMARWLLPLYHPGPRAMIHRTWGEQKRDYALWKSLMLGE